MKKNVYLLVVLALAISVMCARRHRAADVEVVDATTNEVVATCETYVEPVFTGQHLEEQILRRSGYVTSYNRTTLNPNWVGWVLTAEHTDGQYTRSGHSFSEDLDVPKPRADYSDIRESVCGYQRGHMCPAGDNKWSYKAQEEAFLMTNICPQDGDLNQNDWKYLEEECRDWAKRFGEVYIVCGPIFTTKPYRRVGEHGVAVPDGFFKVVLAFVNGSPQAIGFVYENKPCHNAMGFYATTIDEVERLTRLDFFYQLEDTVENAIESTYTLAKW